MKGRAYAIDLLRGLAIVGMVLSGNFRLESRASGMAFPCAGPASGLHVRPFAAGHHVGGPGLSLLPLLDGRGVPVLARTEAGPGRAARRDRRGNTPAGVLLAFFAVALGNLSMWRLNEVLPQPWPAGPADARRVGRLFRAVHPSAGLVEKAQRPAQRLRRRVARGDDAALPPARRAVSVERSDIIILVLANVVVAGSFVWWATRRRPLARLGVVALLVALKIGASVPGSWNETLWNASFAPWLYRAEFMKYLCIVLPGSIAGDLVARWLARRPEAGERPGEPRPHVPRGGARPAGRAGQ